MDVRSFDASRPRVAPAEFRAATLDGREVTHEFRGLTLLIALKTACDGCRQIVTSPFDDFGDLTVLMVSATLDEQGEWRDSLHEIVVAPHLLAALEIKWPPFYALIDAATQRVVREGVIFGPSQIREEIADFISP